MPSKLGQRPASRSGQTAAEHPAHEKVGERAKGLQGLWVHLLVFALVNAVLFLVNRAIRGGGTPIGGSTG